MSDFQKTLTSSLLASANFAAVYFLQGNYALLIPFLVVTAVFLARLNHSKRRLTVYVIGFIFGPIAEAVSIAGGAWTYSSPDLLGVPLWLPFLWGGAALFVINTEHLAHVLLKKQSVS